jgi:hypothetical protein
MVVADFFHLTDAEYASRIESYPDSQLHQQLKTKHMQVKVGSSINDTGAVFGYIGSFLGYFIPENDIVPVVLDAIPSLGKRRVDVSEQKIRLLGEELTRRDHAKSKLREAAERPLAYEKVVVEQTRGRVLLSPEIWSPGILRQRRLLIFALLLLVAFSVAYILRANSYLLLAALRPTLMERSGSVH